MGAWPQPAAPGALWLRASADDLAGVARESLAPPSAPLHLRGACEAAMVKVLNRSLGVGKRRHTAMLVPTRDGFNAVVDSQIWQRAKDDETVRRRLRFVLAHELGHTFFYRPGRPPTRSRPADRLEELFCHRFATSLLVPRLAAREAALDPDGLYGLARRYDVTLRVAAWAIARTRRNLTLLWLHHAPHPARGNDETMRVQWGASDRFIACGESFKSELAELGPGEHGRSLERLRLAGRYELMEIDAWRIGSSMLAILSPAKSSQKPAVSDAQPRLF